MASDRSRRTLFGLLQARPAMCLTRRHAPMEMLESRRLLSTSIWTGAAGDQLFSDGANWQSGVAPASGDDIVFGALSTPQTVSMDNSPTVGNVFFSGTYTINDNQFTLDGDISASASASVTINDTIAITTASHFTADTGATIRLSTIGDTTSDTLDKFGAGVVVLNGDTNSQWQLLAGTLTLGTATHAQLTLFAGTLNGSGSAAAITDNGAAIQLLNTNNAPSTITSRSSVFFNGGSLAATEINTGNQSTLVATSGGVTLQNSPTLTVALGPNFSSTAGTVYTLISNLTGTAVAGTFANLPQGSMFSSGGEEFTISYTGGTSTHDVTLTTVGAAATVALNVSGTTTLPNRPETLKATIGGAFGTPTGTVTFKDNGMTLGTATLTNGVATFVASSFAVGTHLITAVYSGDSIYLTATSPIVTITSSATGPIIARAATAVAATAKTAILDVVGATGVDNTQAGLVYTWSTTRVPSGAKKPTFSINGTQAARTTTALFSKDGTYMFRVTVTNKQGNSVTSDTRVVVRQKPRNLRITPHGAQVLKGGTLQFKSVALDQFDRPMRTASIASFSLQTGSGSITSGGLFNAGRRAGMAIVSVSQSGVSGIVALTIV